MHTLSPHLLLALAATDNLCPPPYPPLYSQVTDTARLRVQTCTLSTLSKAA